MRIEFQDELLQFFFQHKPAKQYIAEFDTDVFELDQHATIFDLLKKFAAKYRGVPSEAEFINFFEEKVRAKKGGDRLSQEVYDLLLNTIKLAYMPFKGNLQYIKDVVVSEYQKKLLSDLMKNYAGELRDGDNELLTEIFKKVNRIKKLSNRDADEADANKGTFLLADYKQGNYMQVKGHPTYLKGLNRMTSVGGFYAPQLVIVMMEPKGFKTGTLLNLAKGYVRDGYNVYYADTENGQNRIKDRMYQSMVEATFYDLIQGGEDDTLTQIVDKYKMRRGDFIADFYPAYTKTADDVEDRLIELKEEFGFEPDIIMWDNIDNFMCINTAIKDRRLQIQHAYFDAIRLQKRLEVFGFTPSQVNRAAVSKAIIDMKDIAEDFGKIANAHAAFALCNDDVERIAKIGRIVPVAQRDGVAQDSRAACYVRLDKARQVMTEITRDEWEAEYSKFKDKVDKKPPAKKRGMTFVPADGARGVKPLTDSAT